MCNFEDFEMQQEYFDEVTGVESLTVEYSTSDGNFTISGIEFHPITPRVVHVYHDGRFLGHVFADNEREFSAALVDMIEDNF